MVCLTYIFMQEHLLNLHFLLLRLLTVCHCNAYQEASMTKNHRKLTKNMRADVE